VQSYLFATLWDDPKRLHACARRFAAARLPAQVAPLLPRAAPEAEPLGVAYVGGDFHDHPIAALLAEVMARHDRSRFRVITASYGPDDPTPQRAAIAAACDRFLDVRTMSDRDAAIAIQAAGADIALDVSGMTLHGRPGILAHRPAPVQIAYLANPGTVGAAHLDYFLSDSFVTPPGAERHFSEQVIRVPPSLFPPDPRAIIVPDPPSRAECGLPEEGFVFCCFNAVNKITPAAYDTWMRILGAVDRSVLWLRADLAAARDNLRREADRRGVDPGRILFAARAAHDRHVARHRCADLFLDTFPYNAGSTAVTAVGAGLPVLTCAGKSYAARMGGSVLEAIGLGELIADSLEAYAALAIALARDPGRLAAVKARLSHSRATAPFFDPVALCRRLEDVYTSLARRRVASRGGGPPR
jgi:predicted O-linked N-acetylglucosamine transferase (SPINDLY family)